MPKRIKEYGFNGLAGCVVQRKARETGTLVGVYDALAAGLESDPETPWAIVCEKHNTLVCVSSLKNALFQAVKPTGFCECCQHDQDGSCSDCGKEPGKPNPDCFTNCACHGEV